MTVHTDTSRSDDLVKRLRGFYCGDMGEPADPINPDGPEAADRIEELTSMEECLTAELGDANDRIEALEAENERLRGMVRGAQEILSECNVSFGVCACGEDMQTHSASHTPTDQGGIAVSRWLKEAAALGEKQ